jgi:hypothetical protein
MKEGLPFVRLMMTVASLAPLFVLAAIKGAGTLITDQILCRSTIIAVIVPHAVVLGRYLIAQRRNDVRRLKIDTATDNREHLLVYLFAVLMPLYQTTLTSTRELIANGAVLVFVVYLFMHMNLHYMNVLFALFGFRVFSVKAEGASLVILTRRHTLGSGDTIVPLRLSNTVYLERGANS